jgi:hypothetical protein
MRSHLLSLLHNCKQLIVLVLREIVRITKEIFESMGKDNAKRKKEMMRPVSVGVAYLASCIYLGSVNS